MKWGEQLGAGARQSPAAGSGGRSVYEQRHDRARGDPGERWVRVGEINVASGEWLEPPAAGWARRAAGWRPLSEFLGERQ